MLAQILTGLIQILIELVELIKAVCCTFLSVAILFTIWMILSAILDELKRRMKK